MRHGPPGPCPPCPICGRAGSWCPTCPASWWSADDLGPLPSSTSSACTARPRSTTPSGGPAGSQWPPPRPSSTGPQARPSSSGPRARDATTRPSPFTRRRSSAQPSRPSWPACPALRSPGSTSTCWSSPVAAAAPGAPVRLLQGVLAAARRSPRYAPSRLLATTSGRAPRSADQARGALGQRQDPAGIGCLRSRLGLPATAAGSRRWPWARLTTWVKATAIARASRSSLPMCQPMTLTFSAWDPFCPCVMSNSTFCPSSRLR